MTLRKEIDYWLQIGMFEPHIVDSLSAIIVVRSLSRQTEEALGLGEVDLGMQSAALRYSLSEPHVQQRVVSTGSKISVASTQLNYVGKTNQAQWPN